MTAREREEDSETPMACVEISEDQNNSASVYTERCRDNTNKSSQIISTTSGSIVHIRGYLFDNIARGVMQSLSPLARGLRGKIAQRHLDC